MKTLIRSGFELVMERERRFATDLYPCWQAFGKYYPEKKASMKLAIEAYLDPHSGWARHSMEILELGNWTVSECRKRF